MSDRGGQGGFYYGSRLLNPLTEISGLPIDQINFLACQLVSLALGFPFRILLNPRKTSPEVRYAVELLIGIALVLFCFGSQIWHLAAHAALGYILFQFIDRSWMPKVTFAVALGYLAVLHIYRQTYDYGGYTLDITGPIMISVQKITGVTYSLVDGRRDEKDLSEFQKKQAIKSIPSALSYFSYIFCYHDVMCGPLVFYNDYVAFIDGSCYSTQKQGDTTEDIPSPLGAVVKKLGLSAIMGGLMLMEPFVAPWDRLFDSDFLYNTNFVYRHLYVLTSMTMHRPRYYFAWTIGELANNNNGLGFNGYDKDGKAKWDLLNNCNIYDLEMATSLKVNIESWNVLTAKWLRHTVYDRAPLWIRTWAVFCISAFWHGFYPGYYILFLTGAFATEAARLMRRNVRPYFQQSDKHKLFYDAVTFTCVRFANCYLVSPHVMLEVVPSFKLLLSLYLWLHIGTAAVIIYFKLINPPKKEKTEKTN